MRKTVAIGYIVLAVILFSLSIMSLVAVGRQGPRKGGGFVGHRQAAAAAAAAACVAAVGGDGTGPRKRVGDE